MPDPVRRLSPLLWMTVTVFGGAAVGLAAFAAGWGLLLGSAPSALGWAVGGVAAAFLGSEVGTRAAACVPDDRVPSQPPASIPAPSVSAELDDAPTESSWRDRLRAENSSHLGPRR